MITFVKNILWGLLFRFSTASRFAWIVRWLLDAVSCLLSFCFILPFLQRGWLSIAFLSVLVCNRKWIFRPEFVWEVDFKFVQRGRLAASVWSLVTVCPAFGVTQHFSLTSSSFQNPARLFKSPDHSFKIQACSFKLKSPAQSVNSPSHSFEISVHSV